jgi:hypothetical protein
MRRARSPEAPDREEQQSQTRPSEWIALGRAPEPAEACSQRFFTAASVRGE